MVKPLVPADLELVEARGLQVDEWELTGELRPVEKRVAQEAVYIYRGSRVTRGSGKGIVVATGTETEYGEILKQPWERETHRLPRLVKGRYCILLTLLLPPFLAALGRYDRNALTLLLYPAAAVVIVLLQNSELFRYLLTSCEARRLEARGIDIRDATCLDGVSRLDIVCLDKTGVLTTPDIKVGGIHFAGEGLDAAPFLPALRDERGDLTGIACALCNDVFFLERRRQAEPIDRALISFALQHGFDIDQLAAQYKRVYDKPFDSEDRYMVAGFERGDQTLYFAKGDPEVILKMCTGYVTASGSVSRLDRASLGAIRAATDSANQQGDIAIALGYSAGTTIPPPALHVSLPDSAAESLEAGGSRRGAPAERCGSQTYHTDRRQTQDRHGRWQKGWDWAEVLLDREGYRPDGFGGGCMAGCSRVHLCAFVAVAERNPRQAAAAEGPLRGHGR